MPNGPTDVSNGAPNLESYTPGTGASLGTVTDNLTGLMWQQNPTAADGGVVAFTWLAASSYCTSLNLAGHQDWRLPTIIELVPIMNDNAQGPAVNTTAFPHMQNADYWSATPTAAIAGNAWFLETTLGYPNNGPETVANDVVCVRGGTPPFASAPAGAPAGRFTTAGTGTNATVTDTKTGLLWQQTPSSGGVSFPTLSWADAKSYCASLALNGLAWRLPTVNEGLTIIDYSQQGGSTTPMIDAAVFPGTPSAVFWTSTADFGNAQGAYAVYLGGGITNTDSIASTNPQPFRCVH
jgi:hypothetical protein